MSPDELAKELALLKARVTELERKSRPGYYFELEERGLLGDNGDISF